MNSSTIKLLYSVCLVLTISITMISLTSFKALQPDIDFGPLITVKIQNNNDYLLGVHCKSLDDDMGSKILKKWELYQWSFHVNIWLTTLFLCGFSQGELDRGIFPIWCDERFRKLWKVYMDRRDGWSSWIDKTS